MISIGKNRQISSSLAAALALTLTGCASQTSHLQVSPATIVKPEYVVESTLPIRTARDRAITARDEQARLDEALDNAAQEDDDEDNLAADDGLAEADPTIEDEGIIGEAVFDAAQDLLDQSTLAEAGGHSNIWPRIRAGFSLPDRNHPRVQPDRDWFTSHQAYLDRTFTRAAPYLHYIVEELEARNMPLEIALLPVVESAFQPFAYSRSHAAGIWQFIPGTANGYGLKIDWWYDGRRDIHASTHAALTYLQKLHKQFNGDWLLALAAYNSGEGTVSRAVASNENLGLGTSFWELSLPAETRSYVPRLLAIADIVETPSKFGLTIRTIPNKPLLKPVNIGAQLDLAIAADLAGLTLEELYILNPGFNRWATSPNGPHQLLLPLEKAEGFKSRLAGLSAAQRMRWAQHEIKRGENLRKVAKHYGITVAAIKSVNNLASSSVRTGQVLMIPAASRANQEYILSSDQRLETKQGTPQGRTKVAYTVRKGDTLWNISTRHNVEIRSLAAWNEMGTKETLRLGQKLVIWQGGKPAATKVSQADKSAQKVKYRVRSGDSLARISQKFNVSVRDLRDWNPTVRGKQIKPGQQLVLFVDVT